VGLWLARQLGLPEFFPIAIQDGRSWLKSAISDEAEPEDDEEGHVL
jgi:hypothetical protein